MTAPTSPSGVAMPEWLARRDRENGAWNVVAGQAVRGDAWTNATERVMRVPIGGDATNRVIRAHEMMHAKVSPLAANIGEAEENIPVEVLRASEEMRVNLLVKSTGFDTDLLVDGSERGWGERAAEMKDYTALATAVVTLAGTKGATAFLRGVRNIDPELAKAIREIEKVALSHWTKPARRTSDKTVAKKFGSTRGITYHGQEIPEGYNDFTLPVARFLNTAIEALTPPEGENEGDGEDSTDEKATDRVKDAARGRRGKFADLVLDESIVLDRTMTGRLGRKRIATNVGRNPRHISRMLTDPQRRIFDRTIRGKGGMIVIDQSGSMQLSNGDIEKMMETSPGCTIIGYSHQPGSTTIPNAWVIAKNGRRASEVPKGNGGNGVDGPALRFAISSAGKGEPIVWVCDGLVTDGRNDTSYANLDEECARLVRKNGIHMVASVQGIEAALLKVASGKKLPTTYVGQVRRTAIDLGFVY